MKMAGGKRQLIDELLKHVPKTFGRYFEPFVGGGALFFELAPRSAILSDSNLFLIAAYKAIRDDVDAVIKFLKFHEARHCKQHYLAARAALVNPEDGRPIGTIPTVAARTIYINRTCFNGLWRMNKKGQFNVPMGDYSNPTICDAPNLRACARALSLVKLFKADFEQVAASAQCGDFVYFDPPYIPVSATSNFVGYSSDGFTAQDQVRLARTAYELQKRGVRVLLSNSDTAQTRELYRNFGIRSVDARRNINSKTSKRGPVGEVIIF